MKHRPSVAQELAKAEQEERDRREKEERDAAMDALLRKGRPTHSLRLGSKVQEQLSQIKRVRVDECRTDEHAIVEAISVYALVLAHSVKLESGGYSVNMDGARFTFTMSTERE